MNINYLLDCSTDWYSCSGWRLEESRIHDPDMRTATHTPLYVTQHCPSGQGIVRGSDDLHGGSVCLTFSKMLIIHSLTFRPVKGIHSASL